MNFSKPVFLAALATTFSFPILAEEQSPIIVTATRTAQTVDDSLASVSVITAKQIEQQQPNDIRDLLTSVAGIDMTNSGGLGKPTSIYMRGTSSKHILVMIDGIKIGSATLGSIAFQHIPVSQIERIEIVRGPRASLYGSNAIGGIIQIFTKQGKADPSFYIELMHGSNNTSKASAGLSGKVNKTSYSLNTSYLNTDGVNALETSDKDEDGYNNSSISANIKHNFSSSSYLSFNLLHAAGNNEYDDSFTPANELNADFTQQTAGMSYVSVPLESWQVTLKTGQSRDKSENFKNNLADGTFITDRDTYSWQNDITLDDSLILTAGVDYQNDKVTSTTLYDKTSRNNTGYYIQQQWLGKENDLIAALRVDDNQAFGNHTTGNIAWGHNFSNNLKLITSYGTAFKAPTFNDLYWPVSGDPTIKPEESESYEIELRGKHTISNWSLSIYHTNISNLIVYPPPTYAVTNLGNTVINGIELNLNTKLAGWDTHAQLSLLDPRDKDTNKILQRRTQQTLRIDMDKSAGKWTTGLSFVGQGHRYDNPANTTKISGYGIINMRASYSVSKKFKWKWRIENLLDKKYETAKNYNNSGLGLFVGLQYQGF